MYDKNDLRKFIEPLLWAHIETKPYTWEEIARFVTERGFVTKSGRPWDQISIQEWVRVQMRPEMARRNEMKAAVKKRERMQAKRNARLRREASEVARRLRAMRNKKGGQVAAVKAQGSIAGDDRPESFDVQPRAEYEPQEGAEGGEVDRVGDKVPDNDSAAV